MPIPIFEGVIYGDTSGALRHDGQGGDQAIDVPSQGPSLTLVGDAHDLAANAVGGDDTLSGFSFNSTSMLGDAVELRGHSRGGNDLIDASARLDVTAAGDGSALSGHAIGGSDVLTIEGRVVTAFGDAEVLSGHAQGGDDQIIVAASQSSNVYGDGLELLGHAVGGDDTLSASTGADRLWGDAASVGTHAATGADLFVVGVGGHDEIMDFEPGKDRIALVGFDAASFQDLAARFQTTSDGVLIPVDAANDLLVRGVTAGQLGAGDFLLA